MPTWGPMDCVLRLQSAAFTGRVLVFPIHAPQFFVCDNNCDGHDVHAWLDQWHITILIDEMYIIADFVMHLQVSKQLTPLTFGLITVVAATRQWAHSAPRQIAVRLRRVQQRNVPPTSSQGQVTLRLTDAQHRTSRGQRHVVVHSQAFRAARLDRFEPSVAWPP